MKLLMFSIKDAALGTYYPPLYARTDNHALRVFSDLVNDPQQPFFKHPQDYALHRVGTFDEMSGQVDATDNTIIAQAAHLKERT